MLDTLLGDHSWCCCGADYFKRFQCLNCEALCSKAKLIPVNIAVIFSRPIFRCYKNVFFFYRQWILENKNQYCYMNGFFHPQFRPTNTSISSKMQHCLMQHHESSNSFQWMWAWILLKKLYEQWMLLFNTHYISWRLSPHAPYDKILNFLMKNC